MTDTLKPCPFCGGKARLVRKSGVIGKAVKTRWYREYVTCKCGVKTKVFKQIGHAAKSWNTRAKASLEVTNDESSS